MCYKNGNQCVFISEHARLKHRRDIVWFDRQRSSNIPYDKIPFVTIGKRVQECCYAKDHNSKYRMKKREEEKIVRFFKKMLFIVLNAFIFRLAIYMLH